LVESRAGLGFGERIWCWRKSIQFCHMLISNHAMLLVQRLVQFWQNFQTSLVLLIPNCTRHHMITYTQSCQNLRVMWQIINRFGRYCIWKHSGQECPVNNYRQV
jgi:hypothetical protein